MPSEPREDALLRAELYGMFSAAFRDPDPVYPDRPRFNELWRALPAGGEFADLPPAPEDLEGEFRKIFGHNLSPDCPPYETHYDRSGIFRKTQTLADLAGFYKAFGVETAAGDRRADHLPVELEFLSLLLYKEARALERGRPEDALTCRKARARFLGEHIAAWLPAFARAATAKRAGGPYEELIFRLAAFAALDAESLGVEPEIRAEGPAREDSEDGCTACHGGVDEKI